MVARVLTECGMHVETEKNVTTVRELVEIDVYAEEVSDGRKNIILCECKHWKSAVPKTIVHAFRTVVGDFGANKGYIISSAGFQSGAHEAAQNTNIELVTWPEFQSLFEPAWLKHFFIPRMTDDLDEFGTLVEPLRPEWYGDLPQDGKAAFDALLWEYIELGVLVMDCSRYMTTVLGKPLPSLPIASKLRPPAAPLPADVIAAVGYRELYESVLKHSQKAVEKFRALREQR
ncbi:restriction endonuclease [Bradyrhizobium liaoningense]|nr:restriction endonuclease [Bradyrhizobium liaoningense]